MSKFSILLSLPYFFCSILLSAPRQLEKDFSRYFKNHLGTIVIYDQSLDLFLIFNKIRSKTKYSPFSTFKIPNSIIALETGVISDTKKIHQWDKKKYPPLDIWPPEWHGQHNMRSAIQYSVVPFYCDLASKIQPKKMQDYLNRFEYGNKDISSGKDNFWLNGSLKISAMEQVIFLKNFYNGKLNISDRTTNAVKDILVREKKATYILSAKTGGGTLTENPPKVLGWYVGYIEKGNSLYFFALNVEGKNLADIQGTRIKISLNILKELKIID